MCIRDSCELGGALTGVATADVPGAAIQIERVSAMLPFQYAMGTSIGASSSGVAADIASATLSRQTMAIKGSIRATDATYRAGAALSLIHIEMCIRDSHWAAQCRWRV